MLEPVRESYRTGVPLHWTRVNALPDYVYFDHSIHVAKGIGCATCHGRIDQMPLTAKAQSLHMRWCIDCHRNPEPYMRPPDKVFDMTWEPSQGWTDPDTGKKYTTQDELGPVLVEKNAIKSKMSCNACHR